MIKISICFILLSLSVDGANFEEQLSIELADLSFNAYTQDFDIKLWQVGDAHLRGLKKTPYYYDAEVFKDNDYRKKHENKTRGFIIYNSENNQIVIVFRGAYNIRDWITFLQETLITKSSFISPCSCSVHSNTLQAYQNMKIEMNNLLNRYILKYPEALIVLTGHGLGGGLATLAAAELAYNGRKVGIITFGSPRIGDDAFYDWYSGLSNILFSFRVVHQEDIVPHLPYQFLGFTHVGQEIWYYQPETYKICRQLKREDSSCSFSLQSFSREDHMNYTNVLERQSYDTYFKYYMGL